jgi:hypothetical protein
VWAASFRAVRRSSARVSLTGGEGVKNFIRLEIG